MRTETHGREQQRFSRAWATAQADRPYHQTVESRFSISSIGRV